LLEEVDPPLEGGTDEMKRIAIAFVMTLLVVFVCGANYLHGSKVKLLEKLYFSESSELPILPWAFCTTDDGLVIIPDFDAGDIKLYEQNENSLDWFQTIGKRDTGDNEFQHPAYCFYNATNKKFGFIDLQLRTIYLFSRTEKYSFQSDLVIPCPRGAYDIQLDGDLLYIAGYEEDDSGNKYSFYTVDLNNGVVNSFPKSFLFAAQDLYQIDKSLGFEEEFSNKFISAIGNHAFFGLHGGEVYLVWEGDLTGHRLALGQGIQKKTHKFGKLTNDYTKPFASPELIDAYYYYPNDSKKLEKAQQKMSLVRDVFTSNNKVHVVYEGPITRQTNSTTFRLQTYSFSGEFEGEVVIPGQPGKMMHFDKDKNILYSLARDSSDKEWCLIKYQIDESQ